jgi:hypothetical protein
MGPCFRVVSREVGEGLDGCLVVEALEAGFVVAVDEGVEESVSRSV